MQVKKTALLSFLKKAGINPESAEWAAIAGAAAPEESADELPAALLQSLDSGLLGLEGAKSNPEVEEAFKGKLFTQVDTKLSAALKTLGLDDAAIKAALDGKKTLDRLEPAITAAVAKVKGENKHTDVQRETDWQKTKLELETAKQTAETQLATETARAANLERDYAVGTYLGNSQLFALRNDLPGASKYARQELLDAVQRQGAVLSIVDGRPFLGMKDDPTKPFHKGGDTNPLNLDDFTRATLDSAGFINKQPGQQTQTHNQQPPVQQPGAPGFDAQANASMNANLSLINQPMAAE